MRFEIQHSNKVLLDKFSLIQCFPHKIPQCNKTTEQTPSKQINHHLLQSNLCLNSFIYSILAPPSLIHQFIFVDSNFAFIIVHQGKFCLVLKSKQFIYKFELYILFIESFKHNINLKELEELTKLKSSHQYKGTFGHVFSKSDVYILS